MAPAATITWRAARNRLDAVGSDQRRPRWPGGPRSGPATTKVSASSSARPVAMARMQHGDRIALGVDRAAEEGAEPAVVAGRPAVVGDAVGRGRRRIGVVAQPLGGRRRADGAEHGCARGHGERPRPGAGERVGPVGAGHPDGPLDLGVVRLELVVVDRPVGHVGPGLGAETGREAEVVGPEAGHLAVGVGPPSAHGGRHRVDLAHVDPVAVVLAGPEGPRLDQGVGPEEVPAVELDLVVGVVEGRAGSGRRDRAGGCGPSRRWSPTSRRR